MIKSTTRTTSPKDRLTRICAAMLATFNQSDEIKEGDRAIVFLNDDEKGGIAMTGYANDKEAIADLVVHLRAMFHAQGVELHLLPIGTAPSKDQS